MIYCVFSEGYSSEGTAADISESSDDQRSANHIRRQHLHSVRRKHRRTPRHETDQSESSPETAAKHFYGSSIQYSQLAQEAHGITHQVDVKTFQGTKSYQNSDNESQVGNCIPRQVDHNSNIIITISLKLLLSWLHCECYSIIIAS